MMSGGQSFVVITSLYDHHFRQVEHGLRPTREGDLANGGVILHLEVQPGLRCDTDTEPHLGVAQCLVEVWSHGHVDFGGFV